MFSLYQEIFFIVIRSVREACIGEMVSAYRILVGSLKGRDCSEVLSINGRIILKWVFRKWGWSEWKGIIWLRIGTGVQIV
jgi:hypothetical protein